MRVARLASVLAVAVLGGAGCVGLSGVFLCEDGAQCVQAGVPGRCEANGYCSFPDPTCPSGSRYGAHATTDFAAMCVGAQADGGVVGADGADADPARCGGTSLLADDFDDGVRSATAWGGSFDNGTPPLMVEQGGEVLLTFAEDEPKSRYAEYRASRTYDLRGDHVRIEVLATPHPLSGAQADLGVILEDGRRIDILSEMGNLLFLLQTPARVTVDFVPLTAAERWWEIRESGGMIYFATSSDGVRFDDRAMVAAPFEVEAVTPLFGGGTYRAESAPGVARFDDFNGGVPSGVECP